MSNEVDINDVRKKEPILLKLHVKKDMIALQNVLLRNGTVINLCMEGASSFLYIALFIANMINVHNE